MFWLAVILWDWNVARRPPDSQVLTWHITKFWLPWAGQCSDHSRNEVTYFESTCLGCCVDWHTHKRRHIKEKWSRICFLDHSDWTTYIGPLVGLITTKPGFESQQFWGFKLREGSSQANYQDQISYSSFLVSMRSKDKKSNSRQHICDQSKRVQVDESNKTLNVQAESETELGGGVKNFRRS